MDLQQTIVVMDVKAVQESVGVAVSIQATPQLPQLERYLPMVAAVVERDTLARAHVGAFSTSL